MPQQFRYIDLFAGCGGISLGLCNAGFRGFFAIEKNPDAFATLKHNLISSRVHFDWPDWLSQKHWDVNTLLKTQANELTKLSSSIDLVVGGPPCQGFSVAGKRRESDKRNKLIHSYLRFVEVVRPRVILFENVHGFTLKFRETRKRKRLSYAEKVIRKLHKLGYSDARGEMIDMSKYGVPQCRKRFIVIATRENLADKIFQKLASNRKEFLASRGLKNRSSTRTALSDLEYRYGVIDSPDTKGFVSGISPKPNSSLQKYFRLMDSEYTPDSHRFVNHTPETIRVFKKLLKNAPRNKRISDLERNDYGIKKRNVTVLDPNKPALTITTIPDDFIHYSEPRVMTVRECARLQSFPDWFEFKGPYTTGGQRRAIQTPRYTQVGNAVPPLFAEQIGLAIKYVLEACKE